MNVGRVLLAHGADPNAIVGCAGGRLQFEAEAEADLVECRGRFAEVPALLAEAESVG